MRSGDIRRSLIVNLDYCLSCRGTCPTCVLGEAERLSTNPVMKREVGVNAIMAVAEQHPRVGLLAVGIGRGNNLTMPAASVDDYLAFAHAIDHAFEFEEAALEISTSLVGKIEPQIGRARQIVRALEHCPVDVRFTVVANTALISKPYWQNLARFLDALQDERGGRGEGNGDILQLNLAADSLPSIEEMSRFLEPYRIPVNLTWAPAFDTGTRKETGLKAIGDWIGEFYSQARRLGLDANIVTRTQAAIALGVDTIPAAADNVGMSGTGVIYVAPDGSRHEGFASVLAEMDPVRYDPTSASASGKSTIVKDVRSEVMSIARNRSCMRCPHVPLCIASGAFRMGLIALRSYPEGTSTCPSGMRVAFDRAVEFMA